MLQWKNTRVFDISNEREYNRTSCRLKFFFKTFFQMMDVSQWVAVRDGSSKSASNEPLKLS